VHDPFDQFDDPSYVGDLPNWAKWVLSTIIFFGGVGLLIGFAVWMNYDFKKALMAIAAIILFGCSIFFVKVIRMMFD